MKKKLELRDIQLLQLDIAKEFKRICEENSIQYFMVGGTLLGAVRHKGFIPWDDDMDFGMTLDNYSKFMKLVTRELSDKYFVQHWNDGTEYGYPFCKIMMKNTVALEMCSRNVETGKGIWIDIFPYVKISPKQYNSKFYMLKLRLLNKCLLLKSNYDLNCLTKKTYVKLLNNIIKKLPVNKKNIKKKIRDSIFQVENKEDSCYLECNGIFNGDFLYQNDYFSRCLEVKFEDTTFKAPYHYCDYLKDTYGDFMQLPPEEQRYVGHSIIEVYVNE